MSVTVVFNDFPAIAAGLPAKADTAVEQTAHTIESSAKAQVPVDTGALRDSINAHSAGQAHWEVSANIRYAPYVEYGTAEHGGPQPFLTPAAHQAEPGFIQAVADAITP